MARAEMARSQGMTETVAVCSRRPRSPASAEGVPDRRPSGSGGDELAIGEFENAEMQKLPPEARALDAAEGKVWF